MKREYRYAVLDMRQPEDLRQWPSSVHTTREGAIRAAARDNRRDPNNGYIAVEWAASATASEFWPCCPRLDGED